MLSDPGPCGATACAPRAPAGARRVGSAGPTRGRGTPTGRVGLPARRRARRGVASIAIRHRRRTMATPVAGSPAHSAAAPADAELKARHRAMWASGDYPSMVETWLLALGTRLVEAAAIGPGMRVLDVAAGTGNASLPAARRGADVTASDLTSELLDTGRLRAEAAGLQLDWVQGDAEDLPFGDGSFDVVMSCIGAMFAPHHERTAGELVRVTRPGGTIALLSWTPQGMVGGLFREMRPYAPPPPPGAQPPPLWRGEDH